MPEQSQEDLKELLRLTQRLAKMDVERHVYDPNDEGLRRWKAERAGDAQEVQEP